MKKKVLFYNGSLRMGGIERVLVEVLQNIDKNKINIDLVIEDGTKTLNVFEKDIPKEIEIFYLKSEKLIKITDSFRKKKKNIFYKVAYNLLMNYESYIKKNNLKKLMKNKKYDVVIDFDMGLSKYIKMINVNKKIAWVHASIKNWYERESRIARLGKRLQQYDNIVTICDEMKEETGNLFPFLRNKLLRIYNPFNFDRILNLSEEKIENKYYELYPIVVMLIIKKSYFKRNNDLMELLKIFNLEFKDYVMKSRTLLLARILREIEKIKDIDNVVLNLKKILVENTNEEGKTPQNKVKNRDKKYLDNIIEKYSRNKK